MNLQLFEDSGPLLGGEPTERHEVINVGWKKSGLPESTPFVEYPLVRPVSDFINFSFQKYYYLKISGIEHAATRVRVFLSGDPKIADQYDVRVFYKLTNLYQQPIDTMMTGSLYDPENSPVIYPRLSTEDPQLATEHIKWLLPDTTYYTEYFVTQVYVMEQNPARWNWSFTMLEEQPDYGNLANGAITLRFSVDEYEDTF